MEDPFGCLPACCSSKYFMECGVRGRMAANERTSCWLLGVVDVHGLVEFVSTSARYSRHRCATVPHEQKKPGQLRPGIYAEPY